MLKLLDEILLSNNVVDKFHNMYQNSEFRNWLIDILPEIEACRNQKQDNPWHIYNCLDHILHSIEEINKQTVGIEENERRMLAYTMFLHDIGKPETHIRRYSKSYGRDVDSFFNHNIAGVKVASRVLEKFGFVKEQIEIIKTLIKEHDMFMFLCLGNGDKYHKVLTKDYIDEKIRELDCVGNGHQLLKYLMMIGQADNMAQNPRMTGDSLKLIDTMKNMLGNDWGMQE